VDSKEARSPNIPPAARAAPYHSHSDYSGWVPSYRRTGNAADRVAVHALVSAVTTEVRTCLRRRGQGLPMPRGNVVRPWQALPMWMGPRDCGSAIRDHVPPPPPEKIRPYTIEDMTGIRPVPVTAAPSVLKSSLGGSASVGILTLNKACLNSCGSLLADLQSQVVSIPIVVFPCLPDHAECKARFTSCGRDRSAD
jgi:hypothetical protein